MTGFFAIIRKSGTITRPSERRFAALVSIFILIAGAASAQKLRTQPLDPQSGDILRTGLDERPGQGGPSGGIISVQQPLRVGLVTGLVSRDEEAAFSGYIEERTGIPVRFRRFSDGDDLTRAADEGRIDYAFMPFSQFVTVNLVCSCMEQLLHASRGNGETDFHAAVITMVNSGIVGPDGLSGRRVAIGQRDSFAGHVLPVSLLRKRFEAAEIPMPDFTFYRNGSAALEALVSGEADAVAVWTNQGADGEPETAGTLTALPEAGVAVPPDLRMIRLPESSVPLGVHAVSASLGAERQTVLELSLRTLFRDIPDLADAFNGGYRGGVASVSETAPDWHEDPGILFRN